MAEQMPRAWKKKNACETLFGKAELKTSLERPRLKWKDIIKADFKETELENTDKIILVQGGLF